MNRGGEPAKIALGLLKLTVPFKGIMLDGLPNFAFAIGYTNSSWTLKVGLVCEHFCRLLAHMDARGDNICYPEISNPNMATRPLLEVGAGCVKRSIDQFPCQREECPWQMSMDYPSDVKMLRKGPVEDGNLRFSSAVRSSPAVAHDMAMSV